MSDNNQHIDVDSDEYLDAPKALRDAYKRLSSQVKELSSERDTLKNQVTASALSGVLGEFKNPERVKRDLLADKIDPLDTEAVNRWIESNGDDYARGQATPAPSTPDASEDAEAHRRLRSTDGLTAPADMSKIEAALAEAGPNPTGAQLEAAYRKHGV